jgi:hypothetical protein
MANDTHCLFTEVQEVRRILLKNAGTPELKSSGEFRLKEFLLVSRSPGLL